MMCCNICCELLALKHLNHEMKWKNIMDELNDIKNQIACGSSESTDDQAFPALVLDPDEYREDLAAFNLTREQENELLAVLWNIMCTMVDIGFGEDSVQMILPAILKNASADSVNKLEQKDSKQQFNKNATK